MQIVASRTLRATGRLSLVCRTRHETVLVITTKTSATGRIRTQACVSPRCCVHDQHTKSPVMSGVLRIMSPANPSLAQCSARSLAAACGSGAEMCKPAPQAGKVDRSSAAQSAAALPTSNALSDQAALERCVRERYDYDAVVRNAPPPEAVEWIFGYGSIVFKQGFEAGHCLAGCIKGWRRGFYQLSTGAQRLVGNPAPGPIRLSYAGKASLLHIRARSLIANMLSKEAAADHRGTPQSPGRTVTLVQDNDARTWGCAYRLPEDLEERRIALQELEWREKQYDLKVITDVCDENGGVLVRNALTYVGSSDAATNEFWGGALPLSELAKQIATTTGLSGPNYEYLYRLADGLRAMHVNDKHVYELELLVRDIRGEEAAPSTAKCYLE